MNKKMAFDVFAPFKNIIFDFGGVFVDLDFQKTREAFAQLGGKIDFADIFSKSKQVQIFNLFETGKISEDEFLFELKKLLKLNHVQDPALIQAWCAMLLEVQVERIEFLKELKKTKKIFLLSNINSLHENHLNHYLKVNPFFRDFFSLFDKVYFSHHLGLRKPHVEIFEYVCTDSSLELSQTLFIDDSIQHIEGAKKFGLAVHHLDPSNSFIVG